MVKNLILIIVGLAVPCVAQAEVVPPQSPIRHALDSSIAAWRFASAGSGESGAILASVPVDGANRFAVKPKSATKAGLLSFLVPGAGEYYLGNKRKARYFFATEAATWLGFFAFRTYGGWKKDDYYRYAREHASADLDQMDEQFEDLIGFYDNIDQYNTEGRIIEPERDYLPDTPENHWDWDSAENRETYRTLKNSSKEAYRRANFMLGVALLSRVISVVDAVRDGRRLKSRIIADDNKAGKRRLQFSVSPFSHKNQLKLTLFTGL